MFNIVLYNFNKRPNSMKKPTAQTSGQTIQCVMKSVSSVITPIIEISDPKLTNSIPLYNYAYIAAFNRYYGTARQTIYPLALFTESSLMGASSAPLRAIKQNLAAIKDFSELVTKVETFDKYLYALNGEQKEKCSGIKNRLLK